jgi:hypothetical protein
VRSVVSPEQSLRSVKCRPMASMEKASTVKPNPIEKLAGFVQDTSIETLVEDGIGH